MSTRSERKDCYSIKEALVKIKPSLAIESAIVVVDDVISQWLKCSGSRKRIKYIVYNPS